MMSDYTYGATVERDEDGVLVEFPAFGGGVFAYGDSVADAAPDAATVLRMAIAEYLDSGKRLPDDDLEGAEMVFTVEVSEEFIAKTRVSKSGGDHAQPR